MVNTKTGSIPYVDLASQFFEEREAIMGTISAVLESGQYVGGDLIAELETSLKLFLGVQHVVAVNSGTDALILGLEALGIGPGDEVITPPNSFISSTAAIVRRGAHPVFVDVLPNQNIDPIAVGKAITSRTKAIMPVHLTGRMADMDQILHLAREYGLRVIEDAAQAIGSQYRGRFAGTLGDVGCFSTHPLKNLNACGDGGFVATNNDEIAQKVRILSNVGMVDRNTVTEWGTVSRFDALQAAILLERLGRLNDIIKRRRLNAAYYQELLDPDHVYVPSCQSHEFNTFHTFVVQVDRRDDLKSYLASLGIGSAIHYPTPIHLQPVAQVLGYKQGDFPRAENQAKRILSLPIHQFLIDKDIARVARAINEFIAN